MAAPVAVLSILVNANTAQATAGLTRMNGQLVATDQAAGKTSKSVGKFGTVAKAGGLAAAAGIGVAVVAVKGFVKAAQDSQVSQSKMQTQLKALGISYKAHAKEIDNVIQKQSKLSGLDDEDLQDSFTNIVRVTGNVSEALKLNALAADIARAKHISLEAASKAVSKAAGGQAGALGRLGVVVKKGATGQEALAAAQQKFSGQAKAYGETAAGAQERFGVAIENLQEKLGEKLLPILTKVAIAVSVFIEGITDGTGAGGKFADVIKTIADVVGTAGKVIYEIISTTVEWHIAVVKAGIEIGKAIADVVSAIVGIGTTTATTIASVVTFFTGLPGKIVAAIETGKDKLIGVGKWVINRIAEGVQTITEALGAIGGWVKNRVVELIQAVASSFTDVGKWVINRIVEGITTITEAVTGIGGWVKNRVVEGIHALIDAFKGVGGWILDKILEGFKVVKKIATAIGDLKDDIVDAIKKVFSEAIKIPLNIDLPDVGKLIGKINPFGGEGGGNVGPGVKLGGSGVDQFNTVASRFGNVITSAYRPGDDGYHGQNRARDYAGGNMLAFAKYMASTFGGKLTELIHTPLGFGIKNGQPVGLGFWGNAVNADHFDHVHVALAQGGIVTRPTRALIGEAGPEAVIPLSGRNGFGGGGTTINVNVNVEGNVWKTDELADAVVASVNRTISRQGRAFLPQTS